MGAIALGYLAGAYGQTGGAIAIGTGAGQTGQGLNAIAIGTGAGQTGQGANAIAIGNLAGYSGQQAANSIVLNATGLPLNDLSANTLVVKPIRNQNGTLPSYAPLFYNGGTGEVISSATGTLTENFTVAGGSVSAADASTLAYSYDGVNWQTNASSAKVLTFADGSCNAVGWNGTTWVAGGVGETALIYSNDGVNWQRNDGSQPGVASTVRTVLDSGKFRYGVDISYGVVPSATQKQNFGASVALTTSGNRLAVGSPYSQPTDISYGFVSIYDFSLNSDTWQKTADLSGGIVFGTTNPQAFGKAVALNADGTRIAIGAPSDNRVVSGAGYVYTIDCSLNSTSWGNQRQINSTLSVSEQFGSALALSSDGNRLLVGAPNYITPLFGVVYDFSFNNNTWGKNPIPLANSNSVNAKYGASLAMNGAGSRCLVGDPNYSTNTGRVYTYDFSYNSGYWGLKPSSGGYAVFDASFAMNFPREKFGYSLAMDISGVRCAIGAPGDGTGTGADRGRVYVYDYTAGQGWGLTTDISGNLAGERFGSAVALNNAGTRLTVGAPYNTSFPVGAGKTYVYNYQNLVWTQETTDVSWNSVVDCSMGFAVALNGTGDRMVSGAPSGDGHAYVFDRQMAANAVAWNGTNWVAGGNSVSTGESATSSALVSSADGLNWQAVSPYTVNTTPPLTKQYFGEFPYQQLGNSMSFNAAGTRLAIGAPAGYYKNNSAVYIYDYDSSLNKWPDAYTQKFTPVSLNSNGSSNLFGITVVLNAVGDRLVIGAPAQYTTSLNPSGAVYIYHMTNQKWPTSPTWSYLGDDNPYYFGFPVKFNAKGDRLVTYAYPTPSQPTPVFYIFHYNYATGSWPGTYGGLPKVCATQYYTVSSGFDNATAWYSPLGFNAAGDRFAIPTHVANSGTASVIHYNYATGSWPGARGSTVETNSAVRYQGTITGGYFGITVELNAAGDKLAVGEVQGTGNTGGSVYIFEYNYTSKTWPGSNGTSAVSVTSSMYSAYYKWSVSVIQFGGMLRFNTDGTRLLVGPGFTTPNEAPPNPGPFPGVLAVFDRNAVTGWPAGTDVPSAATYVLTIFDDPATTFGNGCAISGDGTRIAGGAPFSNIFGTQRGYVNIYDLSSKIQLQQCTALTTAPNNNTLAAGQGVSTVFSASTNGTVWNNIMDDRNVLYSGGDGRTLVRTQALQDPSGITLGQNYGTAVALNQAGTRLAVSVINNSSGQGQVLIYNSTLSQGWTNSQRLTCPDTAVKFGLALSLNAAGTKLL
ncbi:MAG: hypothetical protein EBT62_03610, partial [Opitutaceae bacterium]|nr:hypothetical protein [Opitutaceae bacterium]